MEKNTTQTEQFQNAIEKPWKGARLIILSHKYVTAHCPGLIQALQQNVAGLN